MIVAECGAQIFRPTFTVIFIKGFIYRSIDFTRITNKIHRPIDYLTSVATPFCTKALPV